MWIILLPVSARVRSLRLGVWWEWWGRFGCGKERAQQRANTRADSSSRTNSLWKWCSSDRSSSSIWRFEFVVGCIFQLFLSPLRSDEILEEEINSLRYFSVSSFEEKHFLYKFHVRTIRAIEIAITHHASSYYRIMLAQTATLRPSASRRVTHTTTQAHRHPLLPPDTREPPTQQPRSLHVPVCRFLNPGSLLLCVWLWKGY